MGVTRETKVEGDGVTFPKRGDKLSMHYTGTLASDGSKFDSSRDRNKLFEFTIGVGQVIKGWDEGVIQMSIGERATLHCTADFGYGAAGHPPVIPPSSDLDFDVELVAINGKKGFYTIEEKDKFVLKMTEWKAKKLTKYDDDEVFQKKTDVKYTDRAGYEAFLAGEVEKDCAAVKTR